MPALVALTVVTGLVDAFSYLSLGHVFVANMTGNVVFLAFAVGGAEGFSVQASLFALVAFIVGAAIGGRLAGALATRRVRLLAFGAVVEAVLLAVAAVVTGFGGDSESERYSVIAVAAVGLGMQNAAVRRIAVADLTTTVLTLTITGLAADGPLGAGGDSHAWRRLTAVLAMFAGALVGTLLIIAGHAVLVLVLRWP